MSRYLVRRALAAGIVGAVMALAAPALAPAADGSFSACRASAAQVTLLGGQLLEPTVANAAGSPCAAEKKSGGSPAGTGLVSLGTASAETTIDSGAATADARLADVGANLAPGVLPVTLGVSAATAQAAYTCFNGVAVPTSSSTVAGLVVNGLPINIPDPSAPLTIDLGGVLKVSLNQRTVEANKITQQAVVIESALLSTKVVLAESTVSVSGNPCTTAGVPNPPTTGNPGTPPGNSGPGQTIFVPVPGFTAGFNTGGAVTPGTCAQKKFVFGVKGRGIASTTYFLDGKKVKKVGRNVSSGLPVDPNKLSPGAHRIKAVVTFVGGKVKPKTLNLSFLKCGGTGISILSPSNFGTCANLRVTSSRAGVVFVGLRSGKKSIRAFAQALVTFKAPGSKKFCLPIPPRARNFIPFTTRKFATLTKIGGRNFISRVRTS